MIKEFREFLLKGNLIELAVAFVLGVAFAAVIKSLVDNMITPIIGMIGGVDFSSETFTINDSVFRYGAFINDVIYFVLVAAAIFFLVVKPVNAIMARVRKPEELGPDAPTETGLLIEIRDLLEAPGLVARDSHGPRARRPDGLRCRAPSTTEGAAPGPGSHVSDAIIQLEHVSKRFGQQLAVDDVTVEVPRGRCFAWLGPNGCGKTTLIRMMLGLAQSSGGNIRLRGFEVPKDIRKALSRVGGIVEEPRFYPYPSGRRNLDIWAAHYGGEARSRITSVLERVELSDRAGDKVKTYSLGMRQRLGVARALLNDPELLVLDEPTNGLDPAGMLEFRNMIRDLVEKEGRTVFISSHILDEVQKMADDIAIVQAGRLISWGRVDELIASGRHSVLLRTDDDERARGVLSGISFVTGVGRNEQYKALDLEVADISDERLIAINRTLVEAGVGVAEIWRESESRTDADKVQTDAPHDG